MASGRNASLRWLPAILMALLLVTAGCVREEQVEGDGGDGEPTTQRLSIATGTSGGVYVVYGGGLADVITQKVEGVEATAEVTSASVDNMLLIGNEESDVAFTLADTAADGVRQAAALSPHVVIMDLRLPDGSGLDVMSKLRDSGLRGIALTGYGSDKDIEASLAAGFDAHLVKPVSIDALEALIHQLVPAGRARA